MNIKKLSIGLVLGLTAFTGIAFASTSQATISIGQDTARGNNVYYGTGFVNMTGTCNSGNGGGGLDVSTMEVHKLWPDSTIKDVNVPVGTAKTLYKISLPDTDNAYYIKLSNPGADDCSGTGLFYHVSP